MLLRFLPIVASVGYTPCLSQLLLVSANVRLRWDVIVLTLRVGFEQTPDEMWFLSRALFSVCRRACMRALSCDMYFPVDARGGRNRTIPSPSDAGQTLFARVSTCCRISRKPWSAVHLDRTARRMRLRGSHPILHGQARIAWLLT